LLSGGQRRFSGDDNILERLERDSARQASGNRSRAAWYAAAAALVLLLIVVVAWMAYENANAVRVLPMTRVPADRAGTPESAPLPAPHAGATIVMTDTPGASLNPPLPTHPGITAALPATGAATAPFQAAAARAHDSAGARVPPLVLLQKHPAPPRAVAPAKAVAPSADVPGTHTRPVIRDSVPVPQAAVPRTPARAPVAPRTRKPAPAGAAPEALADRDVALLSAIIIHDSSHADEKAELETNSACVRKGERKCATRPAGGLQAEN
jgi:hypothetical protein